MRRVLVLGLPRGGTTWVGSALGRARGAGFVHEPDGVHEPFAFRARWRDGIGHYAILPADAPAPEYARLWAGAFAGGAIPRTAGERVARWAFAGVGAQERQAARDAGRLPPRLRLAVAAARPLAPRPELDAVVVKSVNAALAAEWIWRRYEPEVLVVRRDLRNVLASWLAIGFGPPRPAVFEAMRAEARRRWDVDLPAGEDPTTRTAVLCAVMAVGLDDDLRRHPQWRALSHEDACREPVAELRGAAAALGLEWTDAATEFVLASNRPGEGYATDRVAEDLPDQWRRRLQPDQVAVVEDVLARFPAELTEPRTR